METVNTPDNGENEWKKYEQGSRMGKVAAGLLLITIGCLIIVQRQGVILPSWLMSWQMLLITIGLLIGAKHRFRFGGWAVPVIIGSVFMVGEFIPDFSLRHYTWPIIMIIVGVFIIFKPRNRFRQKHHRFNNWKKWHEHEQAAYANVDDRLEVTAVFGGAKKNVFTKSFKGGEVTCVFGGAEINLMQADFEGNINLEVTQVFGGAKLLIPAHWKIQSEVAVVFGSVEDKRPITGITTDFSKTLVLTGTCAFGGLEIKSY